MIEYAVLLCAGEGTRMKDDRTHKVCYEIAGVPTVIRLIESFREAGINRFVVVVGSKAEKVMATLSKTEGVVFAYQASRDGTGDAAAVGLKALRATGYKGAALIAMGDKLIKSEIIKELIAKYGECGKQVMVAVQPKHYNTSGGRLLQDGERVCGIIEQLDSAMIMLGGLRERNEETVAAALKSAGISESKQQLLQKRVSSAKNGLPDSVVYAGKLFGYSDIEKSTYVNAAFYVTDIDFALNVLSRSNTDNSQGELYLTDIVNIAAEHGDASAFIVEGENAILTYSTMDELLKLQKLFSSDSSASFVKASVMYEEIASRNEKVISQFKEIYGSDSEYIENRVAEYVRLLKKFMDKYGDREVVMVRAPGRVNLMGRHIEHRGGSINVMAINRETLAVASPRTDDIIRISNCNPIFADSEFSILETMHDYDSLNWIDFIESDSITDMVRRTKGEWINYVKAAVLRLQLQYKKNLLCGMDMLFSGDIPVAAGLSSSSSIVVATAEAAAALNEINIETSDFIDICGEGEWFVGSRGGAGDHAAMKCGKRNMITHLSFFPFEVGETVEFSPDLRVIVANSCIQAKKSAGAKDVFNQRVASYEYGFMMVKRFFPQYSEYLSRLRDINPKNLGVSPSRIYEILLRLPEKATLDEIISFVPEKEAEIRRIAKSHAQPDYYRIRSVMLYGISECMRANKCLDMLREKRFTELGRLMNISHDGDRVYKDGSEYNTACEDEYLLRLIADLKSEEIDRVTSAQIYNQPGGYACSTKVIDELVDAVKPQQGVLGVELAGAGLGGCIIILVRKENAADVLSFLKENYYDKNGLPMEAHNFVPVAGSDFKIEI